MNAQSILDGIAGLRVLVAGDICLDRWCRYAPAEADPSRETGIPRIAVVSTEVTPGAGGTVANNLIALGAKHVAVAGAIGDDGFGFELRRALSARGIAGDHLVTVPGMQTFTYTKLINQDTAEEDQPRVDFITMQPLSKAAEVQILDRLQLGIDAFDVILISDQAETSRGGNITEAVRDLLADLAPAYPDKLIMVDSRARIELFRRVILKPNQQEAQLACLRLFGRVDYPALLRHTESPLLIVTRGADGVLLVDHAGEQWIPALKVETPVDICGAGDSFMAAAGLALKATGSPADAARFGHLAASVTIMKHGTGTASPEEVMHAHTGH